eukprot:971686-Pyramimonas_sp.AAC.1
MLAWARPRPQLAFESLSIYRSNLPKPRSLASVGRPLGARPRAVDGGASLSLIHISEPTRPEPI